MYLPVGKQGLSLHTYHYTTEDWTLAGGDTYHKNGYVFFVITDSINDQLDSLPNLAKNSNGRNFWPFSNVHTWLVLALY